MAQCGCPEFYDERWCGGYSHPICSDGLKATCQDDFCASFMIWCPGKKIADFYFRVCKFSFCPPCKLKV
jgi:hypothetical protein